MQRRILYILLASAGLVLLLGVVFSRAIAGSIDNRLQLEVSRRVEADVAWERVRVNLLRSFPRASVRIDGATIVGTGPFAGDTLLSSSSARLAVDLGSLVRSARGRGALEIHDVEIVQPSIRLVVDEEGRANWDLVPAGPATESADRARLDLNLRRFTVRGGRVWLHNRVDDVDLRITGLEHSMGGRFGESRFLLNGSTSADSVTLRSHGVPYLVDVRTALRYVVDVDNATGTVALDDVELTLNELALAVNGSVRMGDRLTLDVRFESPGGDFAQFASLVPGLADPRWQNANARGTLAGSGWVRGELGDDAFPAFDATFTVRDGRLHHADMPLPLDRVNADLAIRNAGGDADSTIIDLGRLDLVLGANPVSGRLRVATPVSDPGIELSARGTVDLADLARTFPMQDVEDLRGRLAAELGAGFRLSDLDAGRYERVRAEGTLSAADIRYESEAMPVPMDLTELRLVLSPASAELSAFVATLGSSDVRMTGQLENLLGFALRGQELRGATTIASRRFDMDPWRSDDEANAVPVPARLDLRVDGTVGLLTFNELDMTDVRGVLHVRNERATLDELRFRMFDGDFTLAGHYDTSAGGAPAFHVNVNAANVDAPAAFAGMTTVRVLAPAARWTRGRVSADVTLAGRLGEELTPIFNELDGRGAIQATGIALEGFPPLVGLANLVRLDALRNPALADVRSTFSIHEGRLHISPFQVAIGGYEMTVSGSHGFDDSMNYRLAFQVPRSELVADVVAGFATQATRVGLDLASAESVAIVGVLGGTVGQPAVSVDLGQPVASASAFVRQEAERRVEALVDQGQATLDDARSRVDEEAARRREEAQRRADTILNEAQALAEATRREGNMQADALVEQATNPVARRAAVIAADRLRREADQRADTIVREAEARAARLISEAATPPDSVMPR